MSGGAGWMTWSSGKDNVSPDIVPAYHSETCVQYISTSSSENILVSLTYWFMTYLMGTTLTCKLPMSRVDCLVD